jgi:hypothetical protein
MNAATEPLKGLLLGSPARRLKEEGRLSAI